MGRNDLQHCKFGLLLGDKLHLAPINEHPQKILDMGTGSGIWAIDMADKYPTAEVIGVDTAPVQPTLLPPNLIFEVRNLYSAHLSMDSIGSINVTTHVRANNPVRSMTSSTNGYGKSPASTSSMAVS